jgi:hypothetical protein
LLYKGRVVRRPHASGGGKLVVAALTLAAGALALVPGGASAALSQGCTQTNSPPAGEPTEWTCHVNPVSVSGYEVKQGTIGGIPKPAVNGHITRMEVDVVDQNATPVPIDRLMLHHIVFINSSRPDAACGGPERFFGAGEERAKISFPAGYGYPLNQSNPWSLVYMYMNHRAQSDSAWIEYKVTVAPASANLQSVRSYWLDVGNCGADPIYNVPGIEPSAPAKKCKKVGKRAKPSAKRKAAKCRKAARNRTAAAQTEATHSLTKDVKAKEDGWIVAGAGHVHGGAKRLTMTKPGCGDLQVAESNPTWGNSDHPFYNVKPVLHEPGPIGMSAFKTPTGIPVRNGQTIRVNSLYDNLQPHARVMGIFIVYLAPDQAGGATPLECGGAPPDITYGPGTSLPGRATPVPFKIPLTGIDASGNAVEIDGPPGAFRTLGSGDTVRVGDRYFSLPNVTVKRGTTLNYAFTGNEAHNLTLANGPLGIGSPNQVSGTYSQTFDRVGTYRFFCGLHPVQMSERVVVTGNSAKKKKKAKKKRKKRR